MADGIIPRLEEQERTVDVWDLGLGPYWPQDVELVRGFGL